MVVVQAVCQLLVVIGLDGLARAALGHQRTSEAKFAGDAARV
jgi:hypothetical protein